MDDKQLDLVILAVPVVFGAATAFLLDIGLRVMGVWLFLDLATVWFLYGGVAMVTRPEEEIEARGNLFLPGPVGWIDDRFGADTQLSLSGWLSVYPKNLRFVVPVSVLMSVVVLGVGSGVAAEGGGLGRHSGGTVSGLLDALTVLERPAVAVVGATLVFAQVVRFYRCHVATRQHERLTAYMVLDMQVTYLLVYGFGLFPLFFAVLLSVIVVGFLTDLVAAGLPSQLVWTAVVAAVGGGGKLVLERSRVRGERRPGLDDESATTRLSPTPPPETGSVTDSPTRHGRSSDQ